MVWDEPTRRETRAILSKIPPLSWERCAGLFREEHRYPGETHPERCHRVPDPDDRKFAALAAVTGAVLVTNDDHLLAQRNAFEFAILSPVEFWDFYQERT